MKIIDDLMHMRSLSLSFLTLLLGNFQVTKLYNILYLTLEYTKCVFVTW